MSRHIFSRRGTSSPTTSTGHQARGWGALALLLLACGFAIAGDASNAGKADCVGRMQLSFPGEVEIGAMRPKHFIEKLSQGLSAENEFVDGQEASLSDWAHGGVMHITHNMDQAEAARVDAAIHARWGRKKPFAQELGGVESQTALITELATGALQGRAWRAKDGYSAFLLIGSTAISWESYTVTGDVPRIDASYQTLITGLRERTTFDVPKEPDVCLPYLFVKDDGTPLRHVSMVYRLKDHPDITIWLKEGSALTIGPRMNAEKFTAKYKAYQFWMQRFQVRSAMRSLLPFDQDFLTTPLAGQRGVKTFVQLTSEDGVTQDLGYLIAVRGDQEAKEDKPDLMFAVLQNSLNARKRGIEPLDKDAFYKLAETIAASVKRREVPAARSGLAQRMDEETLMFWAEVASVDGHQGASRTRQHDQYPS